MTELTCIVCPNSCKLFVNKTRDGWAVSGNACPRGEAFAVAELTHPMRTLCTTVKTAFKESPVLPVRLSAEIPKDRIFDVMAQINRVTLDRSVSCGDAVIENVLGLGADVIATSSVLTERAQNLKKENAHA